MNALSDDIFEVEVDAVVDLSLKMMDVEMNLEFFRWSNLDSQSVLNEHPDDACEDKLKVSDEKTSSLILELNSGAGSRQVDEMLATNFLLSEVEDAIGVEMDELKEPKELKVFRKDLDPFLLLKMFFTFLSSNLASRIAILFFKLSIFFLMFQTCWLCFHLKLVLQLKETQMILDET